MPDPRIAVLLVLKPGATVGDLQALINRMIPTDLVDSTSSKIIDADFGKVVIQQTE